MCSLYALLNYCLMKCSHPPKGRAADLQLIRLLKAGVVEQAREIRENRKELLFTEASLDAVSGLFIILLKM